MSNRDGTITTDNSEIAEILNEQFESVFSVDAGIEPFFGNRTEYVCDENGLV